MENTKKNTQNIIIENIDSFNDEIINSAIEIKNKLCNDNLRNDN